MTIEQSADFIWDMPELCVRLKLTRRGVHDLMKRRPDFPRPLRYDPNNRRSRLRWFASQVLSWLSNQQRLTAAAKLATE